MFWKCASYALCLGQQIPCTEDQHRPVPSPGTSALRVRPPAGLSLTLAACLATGDCSIYACRCRPDRGIHEMVDGEHVQRWGEKRQHKVTANSSASANGTTDRKDCSTWLGLRVESCYISTGLPVWQTSQHGHVLTSWLAYHDPTMSSLPRPGKTVMLDDADIRRLSSARHKSWMRQIGEWYVLRP